MSGHTRGPWGYSQHKFPNPPFEGALEDEYGVYPPLGESGPVAITTGESNARLIAAAPDLLAALKGLMEFGMTQARLNNAERAIAKALTTTPEPNNGR